MLDDKVCESPTSSNRINLSSNLNNNVCMVFLSYGELIIIMMIIIITVIMIIVSSNNKDNNNNNNKGGTIPVLSLNELGEKSLATIILGNFVKNP